MLAMSAHIPSGLTSRFHHRSGVEGFFVIDRQQCLETADRTYVMNKGDALVIPGGIAMRLVATGPTPRRASAVIVYDASQPPTTRMEGRSGAKCFLASHLPAIVTASLDTSRGRPSRLVR
jgi:hypothetical protein